MYIYYVLLFYSPMVVLDLPPPSSGISLDAVNSRETHKQLGSSEESGVNTPLVHRVILHKDCEEDSIYKINSHLGAILHIGDGTEGAVIPGGDKECETRVTTQFVDALGVVCERGRVPATPDDVPVKDQYLSSFLDKPEKITEFIWATDARGHNYVNLDLWAGVVNTVAPWTDKIHGNALFRGTVCLKLNINATPFQQGVLYMSYLPCAPDIGVTDASYSAMHRMTITNIMQCPGVQVSCRDSSCYLEIPYITPTDWLDVATGTFSWGTLYIDVFSPLTNGGSAPNADVHCTLYAWVKDAEFAGPTVVQASIEPKTKEHINVIPHGKRLKSGTDLDNEKIDFSKQPLSVGLSLGSKVAANLSTIPGLGSLLGPTSWMLHGAAGLASYFGWSKPAEDKPLTVVSRSYNRKMPNADGTDPSVIMGLISENSVMVTDDLTPYEGDEMSLAYVLRKMAPIYFMTWNTSRAIDFQLFTLSSLGAVAWPASPSRASYDTNDTQGAHTLIYRVGPPMAYLAPMFGMWRGSIDVLIQIVGTDFHSGRLMVTWTPSISSANIPTTASAVLALKEIIDIREKKVVRLTLPYLINRPFLAPSEISGGLAITVLNVLRAPETVAQSVDVIVWACAGHDFEFAAPGSTNTNVGINGFAAAYPQSGLPLDVDVIGHYEKREINTIYTGRSSGESITSLKQLLNRYSRLQFVNGTFTTGVKLNPYMANARSITPTTGVAMIADIGYDLYSLIANMYALFHGSVHIMCKTNTGAAALTTSVSTVVYTGNPPTKTIDTSSGYTQSPTLAGTSVAVGGPLASVYLHDNGLDSICVKVPYYTKCKASTVQNWWNTGQTFTPNVSYPIVALDFECTSTGSLANPLIYRRVADEFQFTFFVGAPPLFISST